VKRVVNDFIDGKIEGLNAIVFLSLKKKGGGVSYHSVSQEQFNELVDLCLTKGVGFGFDSCGSGKFLASIKDNEEEEMLSMLAEPCESSCFSAYINAEGKYFPCSFVEGTSGWENGIDILSSKDFLEVWRDTKTVSFRENLIKNERNCPVFEV